MEEGSGVLQIRDAEEAYSLESPTTVSGEIDDTTGVITGADLDTPDITFEQEVENGAFVAVVTAAFSSVTPASGTGQYSPDGELHLETTVRVDLNIKLDALGIDDDCVASPVTLQLDSTEPYDEVTGEVPMADPDFTIPTIPVSATCSALVADRVNPILAGSGHSLDLTLAGDLPSIVAGTTPNTTTLEADPTEPVSLGEAVDLTATITSDDPEVTDAPTGSVRFLEDGDTIGTAAVGGGGAATLSISTLSLGDHEITAQYRGDNVYEPTTSEPVTVTVQADPVVEAEIPAFQVIGADPTEFDVVVDNPSVGFDVTNVRVDVTLQRFHETGSSPEALAPADVLLEVHGAGDVWTPVVLTSLTGVLLPGVTGTLGPALGRPLEVGESLTDRVRLSFPSGSPETAPGPIDVTLDVVQVNPGTGAIEEELSSTTGRLELLLPGLVQTELNVQVLPFAPVRQLGTLEVAVSPGPSIGTGFSIRPTGTLTAAIDGQPVPFMAVFPDPDLTEPNGMTAIVDPVLGSNFLQIPLPPSVGPGPHSLTVAYSGDHLFTPKTTTVSLTVIEPTGGVTYLCDMPLAFDSHRFTAQVTGTGRLPSTARPATTVEISDFALDFVGSYNLASYIAFDLIDRGTEKEITIEFGPEGTGSATDLTLTPGSFDFEELSDFSVALPDEEAGIPISGAPGTVITPTIERITFNSLSGTNVPQELVCEPVDDPITYSPITVAGTTLAVDAPTPARADDDVTLTASVFPSTATGTVRFSDGEDLLDIVSVSVGQAVATVDLPAGEHSLTARFFAGASAPSTTSAPVVLEVLPAFDCGVFAEPGNAAVVRLVYLELLGRCPDQAGFDHWVGQLGQGVSSEVFGRRISDSTEARGLIVDDAYEAMLERAPDGVGRAHWAERLRSEPNYGRLLADLAASGEFWVLAGSTRVGFVTRVYDRLLDRAPEPAGLEFWTDRLAAGTSRRELVTTLANQDEPLGRLVAAAYDEILSRAPFVSEQSNGSTYLRGTGNRSGLYAQLIGRPEFATRAQSFPNPED